MYRKNKFKSFSLCLEVLTCFFSAVLCYFYQSTTYSVPAKNTFHSYQLISYCYGIFRADFSVIQVGEREKMWLSSSEPKFKVCLSSVPKEFHHVEKGKMHHVNGRTGIITTVTNAKLHVMLSHHEDYICSSETGDMWNLPASGLNRSVKNVIRWLENSRCESGLVLEVFNWGGQAPSWMAPCGSPSLC